ncbi:MAG: hypothetical protein LBC18_06515 [Opitutaceae bacterium]|jgi:hypothetical protein|nr:hypothetical protein [Opitutaceae bacterium]
MQNREQIRARNALRHKDTSVSGNKGGEVVKKIPPRIINHGFLAVCALALENKKVRPGEQPRDANPGQKQIFGFIAKHLADADIHILPDDIKMRINAAGANPAAVLLEHLVSVRSNSDQLKQVTSETMAWLNYARRFIKTGTEEEGGE